jgi:hypothetical protein
VPVSFDVLPLVSTDDADCWRNEHQMQRSMVTPATLARGKAARLWKRRHRRSLVPLMCMPRTTKNARVDFT